jgi:hypothetical protein
MELLLPFYPVSAIIAILSALSYITCSLRTPIKHFLARPTDILSAD